MNFGEKLEKVLLYHNHGIFLTVERVETKYVGGLSHTPFLRLRTDGSTLSDVINGLEDGLNLHLQRKGYSCNNLSVWGELTAAVSRRSPLRILGVELSVLSVHNGFLMDLEVKTPIGYMRRRVTSTTIPSGWEWLLKTLSSPVPENEVEG